MKNRLGSWGLLLSAPLLGVLACAGTRLNDVGDTNNGGTNAEGGTGGSVQQPGKGGSAPLPAKGGSSNFGNAGAPVVVHPEGGAGGQAPTPGDAGAPGEAGAGGGASDPCDQNLLKNADFEELARGFPLDWKRYGTPADLVTLDTNHAVAGKNSIQLSMPNSYEYWVQQQFSNSCVNAGDHLRVTGFYRADRANADLEIAVVVGDSDYLTLDPPAVANQWLPFAVEVDAPARSFRVLLWSIGPQSKVATTLWFDSVSLVRVP